ncbi:MAG: acyltransferase family protein [Prevotella sp.]
MKKERQTNFEILRIIAMLMIVLGHAVTHGLRQVTSQEMPDFAISPSSAIDMVNFCVLQLLGYMTCVGVNIFVLITGYFLVSPSRTVRTTAAKGVRIWTETAFYSLLIYAISVLFGWQPFGVENVIEAATPIYHNVYWFVTVYVAMLMLSPFLSLMVLQLSRQQYVCLIAILFVINFSGSSFGYGRLYSNQMGLLFFVFLFLTGAYFRLHNPLQRYSRYGLALYLAISVALCVLTVGLQLYSLGWEEHGFLYFKGIAYNNIPIFSALSLFLWFKNVTVRRLWFTNILLRVSPYVFAVYLIHDNPVVRHLLWTNLPKYIHEWYLCPLVLGLGLLVFALCVMIDIVCRKLYGRLAV